jgi:hypothetical protein
MFDGGVLYTCARPGRSYGRSATVSPRQIYEWLSGLPGPHTGLISLLGVKPNGASEFSYYPFCSEFDRCRVAEGTPTFQRWLDLHHAELGVRVLERPTTDLQSVPMSVSEQVKRDVAALRREHRPIVLMDSGGESRTGQICLRARAVRVL